MPIYEFECAACGDVFERLQKLADPDPSACPQCGKPNITRKVSAPQFRLAGSGWYETDFKKDGERKQNLASQDAPKTETKSETKSSDAAPATPAPAANAAPASSAD